MELVLIHSRDQAGRTPLHYAAGGESYEAATIYWIVDLLSSCHRSGFLLTNTLFGLCCSKFQQKFLQGQRGKTTESC